MDQGKGPGRGGGAAVAELSSVPTGGTTGSLQNGRRRSGTQGNGPDIRRPSMSEQSAPELPPEGRRLRRSSTFSSYSFNEANRDFREEIVDPGPTVKRQETTWKSWLPFMFAMLPPVAGLLFKNGTTFFSDVILLALAAIFLHWSIAAPWKLYHAAQQVREDQETALEEALEETVDIKDGQSPAGSEEESGSESPRGTPSKKEEKGERARRVDVALGRLRFLELMALCLCFAGPAGSSYLLYVIRNFLSRDSEGIVSGFNLGIFLLAAEVSPFSHAIKLVLAHTLHLQRIVHSNPYLMVRITPERYRDMLLRIEELEARVPQEPDKGGNGGGCGGAGCQCNDARKQQQLEKAVSEIALLKVMAEVGPKIEAITRAVRRYERKLDAFSKEVEERLGYIRKRLDDSITLSAMLARRNAERRGVVRTVATVTMLVVTLPVLLTRQATSLMLWPVRSLLHMAVNLVSDQNGTGITEEPVGKAQTASTKGPDGQGRVVDARPVSGEQPPAWSTTSSSAPRPASRTRLRAPPNTA